MEEARGEQVCHRLIAKRRVGLLNLALFFDPQGIVDHELGAEG